ARRFLCRRVADRRKLAVVIQGESGDAVVTAIGHVDEAARRMDLDLGTCIRPLEICRKRGDRLKSLERAFFVVKGVRCDAAALLVVNVGDRLERMEGKVTWPCALRRLDFRWGVG